MPAFEQSRFGLPSSPLPTTHYGRTCARKISLLQKVQPGPDLRGGGGPRTHTHTHTHTHGDLHGDRARLAQAISWRDRSTHTLSVTLPRPVYTLRIVLLGIRGGYGTSDELIQACLLLARSLTRRGCSLLSRRTALQVDRCARLRQVCCCCGGCVFDNRFIAARYAPIPSVIRHLFEAQKKCKKRFINMNKVF